MKTPSYPQQLIRHTQGADLRSTAAEHQGDELIVSQCGGAMPQQFLARAIVGGEIPHREVNRNVFGLFHHSPTAARQQPRDHETSEAVTQSRERTLWHLQESHTTMTSLPDRS